MNVYIVSLKYSPGLEKEFTLLGDRFAGHGHEVVYLISRQYRTQCQVRRNLALTDSADIKQVILDTLRWPLKQSQALRDAFTVNKPDIVLVYNPHPLNRAIFKLAAELAPGGRRILYLHEPGKESLSGYSIKGRLIYKYLSYNLARLLQLCTDTILPSEYAQELFQGRFGDSYAGELHQCPLLVPDQPGTQSVRRWFTMAGRFNLTKRLSRFVELINYCTDNGLGHEFALATASDVSVELNWLTSASAAKLHLVNPPRIDDDAISSVMAASRAVFCLHENVTQSGVVPVAFMNSTPVIVRNDPGLAQQVSHGYNGYVLPYDFTSADMVAAMQFITENQAGLCLNARKTYESIYSPDKWPDYYCWLNAENVCDSNA
ncbi:MAG: glycosyltransferase [Sedimentisphaerales bacterium]|nr:glycosyltransferase [Sedimentisphaerales bacterium]MBN2843953.1 glycosyltransferase [Sedimentisphaerales bacterium]